MALTSGPNLGLLVNGLLGEQHYNELMRQWRGLDFLINCRVKDKDLITPPGSPADGDAYLILTGTTPTGAWAGWAGRLTRWSSVANAWESYVPKEGWTCHVEDEDAPYDYDGAAWIPGSGTYTPTVVGVANVDTVSATACQFSRRGKVVTVSGRIDVDPTSGATTLTTVRISLPIPSNLAAGNQCAGSGAFGASPGPYAPASISGDITNDNALFVFYAPQTGSAACFFTFTYLIA